jgi:hypothetical protein
MSVEHIRARQRRGDEQLILSGPRSNPEPFAPLDRPLFAFAGIWTDFKGGRGTNSKPIHGPHLVHGFQTTAANSTQNCLQQAAYQP